MRALHVYKKLTCDSVSSPFTRSYKHYHHTHPCQLTILNNSRIMSARGLDAGISYMTVTIAELEMILLGLLLDMVCNGARGEARAWDRLAKVSSQDAEKDQY